MKNIIKERNEIDHMVETDVAEESLEKVTGKKIVEVMQKMKSGKATGRLEVRVKIRYASCKIGMKVIMDQCQQMLNGRGMPNEWKTGVIAPICNKKGDEMSCR